MTDLETLLKELTPQVLGVLTRRYGDFETCEDALQEALLAAATQWPAQGVPDNPKGWLITVAARRWIESWRQDLARRRREATAFQPAEVAPEPASEADDTLTVFLLCCHPALTPMSQVALTLRAVGGLSTAQIARALLVPEATVGNRISRAKQTIARSGARFELPAPEELPQRVAAVSHVLYLIFNEGYTASSGDDLHRVELSAEAIRLARQLHGLLPAGGEVAGLLALMLLTDARRPARTGPDGALIALAEQDRTRWDADSIAEGIALLTQALATTPVGPYQLQAAIAALHAEAADFSATDWPQILVLYDLLRAVAPGPMVTLNRIVAIAMVDGPAAGLRALKAAEADPALAGHYRVEAVRAHLLDLAGQHEAAREHYRRAAQRSLSLPEQRYLLSRAVT